MATMNTKNVPLMAASNDIFQGDQLAAQVQDTLAENERRKKLLGADASSAASQSLGLTPLSQGTV